MSDLTGGWQGVQRGGLEDVRDRAGGAEIIVVKPWEKVLTA